MEQPARLSAISKKGSLKEDSNSQFKKLPARLMEPLVLTRIPIEEPLFSAELEREIELEMESSMKIDRLRRRVDHIQEMRTKRDKKKKKVVKFSEERMIEPSLSDDEEDEKKKIDSDLEEFADEEDVRFEADELLKKIKDMNKTATNGEGKGVFHTAIRPLSDTSNVPPTNSANVSVASSKNLSNKPQAIRIKPAKMMPVKGSYQKSTTAQAPPSKEKPADNPLLLHVNSFKQRLAMLKKVI